jgi:periplasmic protein TonB
MLYYNIINGQSGRPLPVTGASGGSRGAAIASSFGLHVLAGAAVLFAMGPQPVALDDAAALDAAAVTVHIEPGAQTAAAPSVETRATAATDSPSDPALADFVPPPPEALVPPDFSTAPPPEPKPAPAQGGQAAAGLSQTPATVAVPGPAASVAPGWNALLAAWLAANRRYPDQARRRGEEGDVTVRFTVAYDGRVLVVAVTKGSGSAALDGAALRLLQGAKLPAPGLEVTRTVRIRFRLGD